MISTIKKIERFARQIGWIVIGNHLKIRRVSIIKKGIRIDIYAANQNQMNIISWMNHPQKGSTKLCREKIDFVLLKKILKNPRLHTSKGYYCNHGAKVRKICPPKANQRNPDARRK